MVACYESDHNMRVESKATVAVSTRRRRGPRPTATAPASIREFNSFSVKSKIETRLTQSNSWSPMLLTKSEIRKPSKFWSLRKKVHEVVAQSSICPIELQAALLTWKIGKNYFT